MASNQPAFLYLRPQGLAARGIVCDPANASFKHIDFKGSVSFRIGVDHLPMVPGQLITFGHDATSCDIFLPPGCSRRQCHFFINPVSGELLLRDDSPNRSTNLGGGNGRKLFLRDVGPRQIVVLTTEKGGYLMLPNAVLFDIVWDKPKEAFQVAKTKSGMLASMARRAIDAEFYKNQRLVHRHIRELGRGSTATVFLTVDMNTGDHLAVKIFRFESIAQEKKVKSEVKKELRLLSLVSHPNISVLLHHQGWRMGERLEFFIEPYTCSLHDILGQWQSRRVRFGLPKFFPRLMKQMLDSLVYLDSMKIIHRDIKPENILVDEKRNFYLTDFGLSKVENLTQTVCGTDIFMAPEIRNPERRQTTKIDVWSMAVLILEVLDVLPDYERWFEKYKDRGAWADVIIECAKKYVPQILPMLEKNPEKRYSARECLEHIFNKDLTVHSMPIPRPNEPSSVPVSIPSHKMREGSRKPTTRSPEFLFTIEESSLSSGTTPTEYQTPRSQSLLMTISPSSSRPAAPARLETTESHARREVRESPPRRSSNLMFPVEDVPSAAITKFADAQSQALHPQVGSTSQAAAQSSPRRGATQRQRDQSSRTTITRLIEAPNELDSAENLPRRLRGPQRSSSEASSSPQAEASSSSQRTQASPAFRWGEALSPYALDMRERGAGPSRINRNLCEISLDRHALPTHYQRRSESQPTDSDPSIRAESVDTNKPGCYDCCKIS